MQERSNDPRLAPEEVTQKGHGHTHDHSHGHQHHHHDGCCDHDHDHGHQQHAMAPVVRGSPKVGRNDPCPCGSGKKHKKCCLG